MKILFLIPSIISFVISQEQPNATELEDGYVKKFGNDPNPSERWETAEVWYNGVNATKLKRFCASAHVRAGKGSMSVDVVLLRHRILKFVNPNYHPMRILVAAYGIMSKKVGILDRDYWYTLEPDHWYLTEGQRADCCYFLNLTDTTTGQFILDRQICGIEIPN